MTKKLILALLFLLTVSCGLSLHTKESLALTSDWIKEPEIEARLVTGVDTVGEEKSLPVGLELRLAPEWHTYWRTPGDAGLPPALNWSKATNLESAFLLYPSPRRYSAYGMETIGYRDAILFPIDAVLNEIGKPVDLALHADILICKEICLPKSFDLSLTVPAGALAKSKEAELIAKARATVPASPEQAGMAIRRVERFADKIILTVKANPPFTEPDLFIENDSSIPFDRVKIDLTADARAAVFTLTLADSLPDNVSLINAPFTVTLINGDRTMEAAIGENFEPQKLVSRYTPYLRLLGFALLAVIGGFILNLTPCVLPVLSLKIMGLLSHSGREASQIRRSFLTTAAGILFSFFLLGAGMVALKMTGKVVGWGVQFQQPGFLLFLILILTLFTANLWDLFEISLPQKIASTINPHDNPKLAGDFATGALATLLATPCSAPFLGTAVAFALASGASKILVIFLSLGLGMALPYFTVALFPSLAARFPKPGGWMLILRRILGLSLLASTGWLLHVLSGEISQEGMVTAASAVAMILGALALHKNTPRPRFVGGVIALAMALAIGSSFMTPPVQSKIDPAWERFDENAIQRHVAEGKTVFVDVTANWCLTCKANKKLVLARPEISMRLFSDPNVIPMQADWTNPDPKITAFLQRNGRYGVPFNIVFGPKAAKGIPLPELLTTNAVTKALNQASGSDGE